MKNLNILFRGAVFSSLLLLLLAGCSSPTGGKSSEEERGQVTGSQPQTHTVEIRQMAFSPSEIIVRKGDKVTFVNHDMVAHDVTEESSKAWTSSPLQPQQSWTLEVNGPANYYCSLHQVMKGKITVR